MMLTLSETDGKVDLEGLCKVSVIMGKSSGSLFRLSEPKINCHNC